MSWSLTHHQLDALAALEVHRERHDAEPEVRASLIRPPEPGRRADAELGMTAAVPLHQPVEPSTNAGNAESSMPLKTESRSPTRPIVCCTVTIRAFLDVLDSGRGRSARPGPGARRHRPPHRVVEHDRMFTARDIAPKYSRSLRECPPPGPSVAPDASMEILLHHQAVGAGALRRARTPRWRASSVEATDPNEHGTRPATCSAPSRRPDGARRH
jgi:hypothetical protein